MKKNKNEIYVKADICFHVRGSESVIAMFLTVIYRWYKQQQALLRILKAAQIYCLNWQDSIYYIPWVWLM